MSGQHKNSGAITSDSDCNGNCKDCVDKDICMDDSDEYYDFDVEDWEDDYFDDEDYFEEDFDDAHGNWGFE